MGALDRAESEKGLVEGIFTYLGWGGAMLLAMDWTACKVEAFGGQSRYINRDVSIEIYSLPVHIIRSNTRVSSIE